MKYNNKSDLQGRKIFKSAKGKRRKKICWDYNMDGMSGQERIKGFWKRYWRKWENRNELPKMHLPHD